MAQMVSPILGEYENFLYGPPEKNHYHYVSILADNSNKGGYIWRTLCNEWTLTPIQDRKLEFSVGDKCPYFKNGYKTMKFKTDHKNNIIGAVGPGNEYFTKIEQHSIIKYNLKGVKKPNKYENDDNNNNNNNDEKEGINTDQGDNMNYNNMTRIEWKGGKCTKNKCIGRVNIEENFIISFGLQVHGKNCDEWENILHVGGENMQRSPGIWLHPKSYKLHIRLSDTMSNNTGYDPNMELEKDMYYKIKLQCIDTKVSLFINDKLVKFSADVIHLCRFKCPVFVSDPWYTAANCTITDLKIVAPQ